MQAVVIVIFYFSGTGNSLQAAKNISERQNDRLISVAQLINQKKDLYEFTLKENEAIGFVFPVYAWGPPMIVLQLVERLKFTNYRNNFVYAVATCGDNIGNTMKKLDAALKKKGLALDSGFSVRMPNNYIVMFDIDSEELQKEKLTASEESLRKINRVIADRQKGVFDVLKGFMPDILTYVVNPLFNKHAIDTTKFYATDKCTGCGICAKVCNCRNIKLEGVNGRQQKKPVWEKECTQCLACIHFCPAHAAQYGKSTERKGRYTNPNVRVEDMIRKAE